MRIKISLIVVTLSLLLFLSSSAQIKNSIVAKVGNEIITTYEIENEIRMLLFFANLPVNQVNINNVKNTAMQSLVKKSIKNGEIKKYEITQYSKIDLENQMISLAKKVGLSSLELRKALGSKNISYDLLKENMVINLKWNTLIFRIYKNQVSINTVEIENELRKRLDNQKNLKEYNLSEIEISESGNSNEILKKIYNLIESEGFKNAVTNFSISDTSKNEGKIGWVSEGSLSKIYQEALRNIEEGNVTRPIKNLDSLVILKVNEIKYIKNDEINIENIKEKILEQKKAEKLDLFSRSHYSNLENSILVNFL